MPQLRSLVLGLALCPFVAAAQEPEPSEPVEAPASGLSGDDALRAELEALRRDVEAYRERLERAEEELETHRKGLTDVRVKQAANDNRIQVDFSGYYRVRGHVWGTGRDEDPADNARWPFRDLDDNDDVPGELFEDQPTSGHYLQHRLRLGVKFSWKDVASLNVGIQALDNVVFGDNIDLSRTAVFASTPSYTGLHGTDVEGMTYGEEVPSVEVFRAWTEFKIPVGVMRIGRQPMHLGLGILANDGDGFRNDFGEAHYGSNLDRILFATNPVKIAQTFTKKQERYEVPLLLAVAYDRLVSDPYTQYFGYKCKQGATVDIDPRCDPNGDGVADFDRDYQESAADRAKRKRRPNWWADQRDDAQQMVYALIFRGDDVPVYRKDADGTPKQVDAFDLTAGTAIIHRWQQETESQIVVLDFFADAAYEWFFAQAEGFAVLGKTRAIVLPDDTAEDPLQKEAKIGGYVARVGYRHPMFRVTMESGLATGDDQVNDDTFTGRPLEPDHNVGLILYEEVLRLVTETLWAGNAFGLRSRGGVYNSHYINPKIHVYPNNNTQIIAGFVMAWPDRPDGAVILCDKADAAKSSCSASADELADTLGWEIDFAVKHTFQERIAVSFETGYAEVTNRIPLEVVGLNKEGKFWTFQARAAWLF